MPSNTLRTPTLPPTSKDSSGLNSCEYCDSPTEPHSGGTHARCRRAGSWWRDCPGGTFKGKGQCPAGQEAAKGVPAAPGPAGWEDAVAEVDGEAPRHWKVPPGFVDVGLLMTIAELSDRVAQWGTQRRKSVAAGNERVAWEGCGGAIDPKHPDVAGTRIKLTAPHTCSNPTTTASLHVPMADANGRNGEYTLYGRIGGEHGIQAIVMACLDATKCMGDATTTTRRFGVYVAFGPTPTGFAGAPKKVLRGMNSEAATALPGDTSAARVMDGWHVYYESLADAVWQSAAGALKLCDETVQAAGRATLGPCPLIIGGNSMAGQLAALAAYDVALGDTNKARVAGQMDQLRQSR